MSEHVDLLIAASRDDALSVAEQRRLDSHLATCARCAALARTIQRNDSLLAQREPSIAVRGFEGRAHSSRRASAGFAFAATAAVVLAIVFGAGLLASIPRRDVAQPPTAAVPVERCADARPASEIAAAGTLPYAITSPDIVCIVHAVRSGPGHDRAYRLKDGRNLHVYLYEGQLPSKPIAPTRDTGTLDLGGSPLAWAILEAPPPLLVVFTQLPTLYVSLDVPLQEQARDLALLRDIARPLVVAASAPRPGLPSPQATAPAGATAPSGGTPGLTADRKAITQNGQTVLAIDNSQIVQWFRAESQLCSPYNITTRVDRRSFCTDVTAFRDKTRFVAAVSSPDGMSLGFTVETDTLAYQTVAGFYARSSGKVSLLTHYYDGHQFLSFSPTGSRFVYTNICFEANCALYVRDTATLAEVIRVNGPPGDEPGRRNATFLRWLSDSEIEYKLGNEVKRASF